MTQTAFVLTQSLTAQRPTRWDIQARYAFRSFIPQSPVANSPDKLRYNAAWERALALRDDLVACLRQQEHTVTTDGLVELNVSNFLRGATDLVHLPTAPDEA